MCLQDRMRKVVNVGLMCITIPVLWGAALLLGAWILLQILRFVGAEI